MGNANAGTSDKNEASGKQGALQLVPEKVCKVVKVRIDVRAPPAILAPAIKKKRVAILAWSIGTHAQGLADEVTLQGLHDEIGQCLRLFEAEVLVDDVASGLITGRPLEHAGMNAVDACVRFGQLLCRWAVENAVGLRIGVHVGDVKTIVLMNSGGRLAFFGDAVSGARQLMNTAAQATLVHLSCDVKDNLIALRHIRLIISPDKSSYYLDPSTRLNRRSEAEREETLMHDPQPAVVMDGVFLSGRPQQPDALETKKVMSRAEFEHLLADHNVDISKFGKGSAKSLEDFYEAVVLHEKSFLVTKEGTLKRVVILVRISLRARDGENKLRELRVASQLTKDNKVRIRNQHLAMVLKVPEHGRWQEAVEQCFEEKLGLSPKVQRQCFATDTESYSYKEEPSTSETIPGIESIYKVHSVFMNIKDTTRKELGELGLPKCADFSANLGGTVRNWTWDLVGHHQEDELMNLLHSNGIDVSEFSSQAFSELYDEVYNSELSTLQEQNGELVRTIRIIKVWLHADILNVDHVLVTKNKFQKGKSSGADLDRPVSMRMRADQEWDEALAEALYLRLGISRRMQADLATDRFTHRLTEETAYSRTYPGLKTTYLVNEVSVRTMNFQDSQWRIIGLPSGTEFTFARREIRNTGDSDVVMTTWCWKMESEMGQRKLTTGAPSISDAPVEENEEPVPKRRTPAPTSWLLEKKEGHALISPIYALETLMKGKTTDWVCAKRMVARIRDPEYTCREFFDDIVASFPELNLYCAQETSLVEGSIAQTTGTTGGRTADEEFQRTVGALFAVFWLMRLHADGKKSFCFGLDKNWKVRDRPENRSKEQITEFAKRKAFYENIDWASLERLFVRAGLLKSMAAAPFDQERTLAMIVLMVIHDIMKLNVLLPTVPAGVEFCGFRGGEVINDHDTALSYVLMHHPQVLPSFAGLTLVQQDVIRFTHCKMEYNMGWLVQAEAPPAALFRTFRKVVIAGGATASDVAFYFVHWFVDLAAAEPVPLEGCEKFVLKFPRVVLQRFLDSFTVVQQLGPAKTETQVLENYLLWRWDSHEPSLGPAPSGKGSIAKMRLMLMAQGDSQAVISQFDELDEADRDILCAEMAITGCVWQAYERDSLTGTQSAGKGPAILVYYSPALMQKAGKIDMRGAMGVLAEVFRQARELWPLSNEDVDRSVTVRIDTLKELEVKAIKEPEAGMCFLLSKSSNQDAAVKLSAVAEFNEVDLQKNKILTFTRQRQSLVNDSKEVARTKVAWLPKINLAGMRRKQGW